MNDLRATMFQAGRAVERVALSAAMPQDDDSAFVWIEALNPLERDFEVLQKRFNLHALAVKDAMSATQVPKVDIYDDQIFVVLKIARLMNDEIEYAAIDAFISGHHIITVRHDGNLQTVCAEEDFWSGGRFNRPAPDFVLHAIIDFVVNNYFPVVQMIEDEVLSMEQRLLDAFLDRAEVNRLFRLRREAIHLQHVLTRMSDVCGKLANLDVPCIGAQSKPYFRDVHDQLIRLDGMIGGLIDVIRAVFEASSLLEQQRQGVSTRQLAGWAAILGAPTAIAGVYGMNFPNMPELALPFAYPVVLGLMLLISVGLYLRFKRLRWL
jgi:magnesium transporter